MEWKDEGFVLQSYPHGENFYRMVCLTRDHGKHSGLLRKSQKAMGIAQTGNKLSLNWQARTSEQLGIWKAELVEMPCSRVFQKPKALTALETVCHLLAMSLADRESVGSFYTQVEAVIDSLCFQDNWDKQYIDFELHLLRYCGYGLQLNTCCVTKTQDDLCYVSPKSGNSVCYAVGLPYQHKLLALPKFLRPNRPIATDGRQSDRISHEDMLQAFDLTGYFLERHVSTRQILPAARTRLRTLIEKARDHDRYR